MEEVQTHHPIDGPIYIRNRCQFPGTAALNHISELPNGHDIRTGSERNK